MRNRGYTLNKIPENRNYKATKKMINSTKTTIKQKILACSVYAGEKEVLVFFRDI